MIFTIEHIAFLLIGFSLASLLLEISFNRKRNELFSRLLDLLEAIDAHLIKRGDKDEKSKTCKKAC